MTMRIGAFIIFLIFGFCSHLLPAWALSPLKLTAETNEPNTSTFPIGKPVSIIFSVKDLMPWNKTTLLLEIRNEFNEAISTPEPITLTADESGNATYVFTAPASKLGYYEVWAKLNDGTVISGEGTRSNGFISYAVVPDPMKRIDYGAIHSRFGLQGSTSSSSIVLPYLGTRYILADNDWQKMEPQHINQFLDERYKADHIGKRYPPINDVLENQIYLGKRWVTYDISIVIRASLPSWALKLNTEGTIFKSFGELNEQGKEAFPIFALAQSKAFAVDYKDQIRRYYQVTWEPASGWGFGGTAEGLVEFFSKAYPVIHQGDPHAIVAGPTLFIDAESTKQLNDLWTAGLGKYIDALSFHPYVKYWPPETNGLPAILREQLKSATQAVGHPIPFIGTEHGFKSSEIGNLNKALGDIRSTLIMLGEGASFDVGFYVADFWDGDDPSKTDGYGFYWNLNPRMKFNTDKLGPKAIVPAYAAMTYFLDGTISKGPLSNLQNTQMGYKFVRNNKTIEAVWDYGPESSFLVPHDAYVCDWMGNCSGKKVEKVMVGAAPTYFIFEEKQ